MPPLDLTEKLSKASIYQIVKSMSMICEIQ